MPGIIRVKSKICSFWYFQFQYAIYNWQKATIFGLFCLLFIANCTEFYQNIINLTFFDE